MEDFFKEMHEAREQDDFDEFLYKGKKFVNRKIHFLRDYDKEGFTHFRCPHCNVSQVINNQEMKPCVSCKKLLAVQGGAFYYELY